MKANTRTLSALGLTVTTVMLALSGCGTSGMSASGTTAAPTAAEQAASSAPITGPVTSTSSPSSPPAAAGAEILIKGFKYQGTETVSPGATISVTNEDIEAHTITADTSATFDAVIKAGTGTFTAPTKPGTYPYHCTFHGNMKGTLTVTWPFTELPVHGELSPSGAAVPLVGGISYFPQCAGTSATMWWLKVPCTACSLTHGLGGQRTSSSASLPSDQQKTEKIQ